MKLNLEKLEGRKRKSTMRPIASAVLLAGLAFGSGAAAVTSNNPYQQIVSRNVFRLKDPPPQVTPAVEPAKPQTKLTLTGISTMLGKKIALMKAPPPIVKPGEQPKGEQYYMLKEGERDGDVLVVSIDERLGKVTVKNSGEVVTLSFDDTSRSSGGPSGAQPAGVPGLPSRVPPQQLAAVTTSQAQPGSLAQTEQPGQVAASAVSGSTALSPAQRAQSILGIAPGDAPGGSLVASPAPEATPVMETAVPNTQTDSSTAQSLPQRAVSFRETVSLDTPTTTTSPSGGTAGNTQGVFVRGVGIQHPAIDPSLGAEQLRTPFPTRSLRGRGRPGYHQTPGSDGN